MMILWGVQFLSHLPRVSPPDPRPRTDPDLDLTVEKEQKDLKEGLRKGRRNSTLEDTEIS